MIRLINYIRKCFCKHDWELLGDWQLVRKGRTTPYGHIWLYRCKKCGVEYKYKVAI